MINKRIVYLLLSFAFTLYAIPSSGQSGNALEPGYLSDKLQRITSPGPKFDYILAQTRSYLFRMPFKRADMDTCRALFLKAKSMGAKLGDKTRESELYVLEAMILNRLGQKEKGLRSSMQALEISTKLGDSRGMAEANIIIGQHYPNDGKGLEIKIGYYKKAIELFLRSDLRDRAATTLKDLGDFQILANKNPEAQKSLNRALFIYQSTGYKELQGVYDLMGYNMSKMGDYINGLKYSLLAVKTAENLKDTSAQIETIYYRAGFAYYMIKQYKPAGDYIAKALKVAYRYKDTSAIIAMTLNQSYAYLKLGNYSAVMPLVRKLQSLKKFAKSPGMDVEFAYFFMSAYLQLRQFEKARPYFEELQKLSNKSDIQGEIHEKTLKGIVVFYQTTGQFKASYTAIAAHRKFCVANNFKIFMPPEELWLFKADSASGNYLSAIKHYQNFKSVDDSVLLEKNSRQTALLNIQYETDKKDKNILLKTRNIELLTKQAQYQKIRLEQEMVTRKVIIAGTLMLVIILLIGYNRFRLKQRSNLMLKSQQSEINKQNEILQTFNGKQSLLLKEKEWLLREIHHRVKNNLQVTMSLLNIQSSYLSNTQALDAIKDSQRRIHAMSLIHQKLYQSNNLASIEMSSYIPELIDYLKESFENKTKVEFVLAVAPLELDVAQAVPIGLILNEAITNSMKYAFDSLTAAKIEISISNLPDGQLKLTIQDNGIGLPDGFEPGSSKTLGMNLMRGLAEQIDGEFSIHSAAGTSIAIVFREMKTLQGHAEDAEGIFFDSEKYEFT